MVYKTVAFPVISLSVCEGYAPVESLFRWIFLCNCVTADNIFD